MVLGVSGQLEWADRDAVLAVLAGAFLGQVLLPSLTVPSSTQTLYRVLFIFGTPQEPGLVLCDASMTGEMNVLSQGSPPFSTTEDLLAQHNISSFCTGNCAPLSATSSSRLIFSGKRRVGLSTSRSHVVKRAAVFLLGRR